MKPYLVQPRDPATVCVKTPVTGPEDFYETTLTPDEAELYGLELMLDAKRARFYIESQARLRKPKA